MNKPKIFIVEDDVMASEYLEIMLEENGYEVIEPVTSGEEALGKIPLERPDVIILDVKLDDGGGELDGIQVAQKLIQQNIHVPVIYLTGNKDKNILRRMQTPFESFLNKPTTEVQLIAAVENALMNKSAKQDPLPDDFLFILKGNRYEKVFLEDILYLEAADQYITVYTINKKQYLAPLTLKAFDQKYGLKDFIRIKREYMANITHVTGFEGPATLIMGDKSFQIGQAYRKSVKNRLPFLKK